MLYKYNIQNQGSEGDVDLSTNGPAQARQYYPRKENQLKIRALALSCFVDECEIGGTIMQKHH